MKQDEPGLVVPIVLILICVIGAVCLASGLPLGSTWV